MADHPNRVSFHGLWRSHKISRISGTHIDDGTIEHNINDANGTYTNGNHVPRAGAPSTLTSSSISDKKILFAETAGSRCSYEGFVAGELSSPSMKVIVGSYTVPARLKNTQDNGVWIATQP